jgi:hypothetical protein
MFMYFYVSGHVHLVSNLNKFLIYAPTTFYIMFRFLFVALYYHCQPYFQWKKKNLIYAPTYNIIYYVYDLLLVALNHHLF